MRFHALAATAARARLAPFEYEPGPLADAEVEIEISHCGICHSDVHLVDGDWGEVFPLVPGHEIVGVVVAGDRIPVGTRVGVGWQRGSCGTCEYCLAGEEAVCAASQATCVRHFGGFADRIRVDHRFAIPLPSSLESASAAPLLCGGITVWSPLARFAGAGARVGVVGIGGLGHLALQFARALGCDVTAFSGSTDKERAAIEFGAHRFSTGAPAPRSFDLVINTAPAAPDLQAFLAGLRPKGAFCQVGAAADPLVVPAHALIDGDRVVAGSAIGSPRALRAMLDFAARHAIRAQVETVPMADANAALDRTRGNRARFRMVLAN